MSQEMVSSCVCVRRFICVSSVSKTLFMLFRYATSSSIEEEEDEEETDEGER